VIYLSSEYQKKQVLVELIIEKIQEKTTGENVDIVYDVKPSRKYFVGNLSPKIDINQVNKVMTKIAPSSLGFETLLKKDLVEKSELTVDIRGVFYYRIFPNYSEQKEFYDKLVHGKFIDPIGNSDDHFEAEGVITELKEHDMRLVYRKKNFDFKYLIPLKSIFENKNKNDIIMDTELNSLKCDILKDERRYRTNIDNDSTNIELTNEIMESSEKYNDFIKKFKIELSLDWKCGIKIEVEPFDDTCFKLKIYFENLKEENFGTDVFENSIFEVKLITTISYGNFNPFILPYLKDDYKYDGIIEVSGHNCTINLTNNNKTIETVNLPIYKETKYRSNPNILIKFDELIDNPIVTLEEITKLLEQNLHDIVTKYDMTNLKTKNAEDLFEKDITDFRNEIERYKNGLNQIKMKKEVKEAFKLMNETFKNSPKGYTSWYLYQIVFIVMVIPDIISHHYKDITNSKRDFVDLIYFPTGGGKTECYLGAVIFCIFFDRLIGKTTGVSAIARFPLRLLSIQQLQRIANIFAKAEEIRTAHTELSKINYEKFSMGFYVGGGNTPNKLIDNNNDFNALKLIKEDESIKEKWKIITICPFCQKENVDLIADEEHFRIIHYCNGCNKEIPVYISDDELYRYLPTFIIGTLDKMATIGFQKNFRHLLGLLDKKCPDHGYFNGDLCPYHYLGCKRSREEYEKANVLYPFPTLIIQDELHLIREEIGTYDSHYESFIDHYMTVNFKTRCKIIAATATISNYESQLYNLYRRQGFKFPSEGPYLKKSIYAEEIPNEIGRYFLGLIPHNKTIIYSVLDILRFYQEIIQDFLKNPKIILDKNIGFSSIDEVKEILYEYYLMLSYNLVKVEGDAINKSLDTMVNPRLENDGYSPIIYRQLTGDVRFSDIKEVLAIVENPHKKMDINQITATSMISHGVDIDSMNFMVFRGMPRNTAEYLQAASRVGRKYPGIVVIIFNHLRERDQSYYKYFVKFHKFINKLIEPVPINRWAKFAIKRTLPGIFSATILNHLGPKLVQNGISKYYMSNGFKLAFDKGLISEDELIQFIRDCYKTVESSKGHFYNLFIETEIKSYISAIISSPPTNNFLTFVMPTKPMLSLRDTDEMISVSPDNDSSYPMYKLGSRYE